MADGLEGIRAALHNVARKASETNRAGATLEGRAREALAHLNALDQAIKQHLVPALNTFNALTTNAQGVGSVNDECRSAIHQVGSQGRSGTTIEALLGMSHAIDEGAKQTRGTAASGRQSLDAISATAQKAVANATAQAKQAHNHAGNVMRIAASQVAKANEAIAHLGSIG